METKFNFKSQPYTTIEQSQRLIELGLKAETADCCHWYCISCVDEPFEREKIPAWSLARLMELANNEDFYFEVIFKDGRYGATYGNFCEWSVNLYNILIDVIETAIKEGYFNKEYLV